MKKFLEYLEARLSEKSTWIGLIGFVSAAGVAISPEMATQITVIGTAIASLLLSITKG